jgi:hypothetical protein
MVALLTTWHSVLSLPAAPLGPARRSPGGSGRSPGAELALADQLLDLALQLRRLLAGILALVVLLTLADGFGKLLGPIHQLLRLVVDGALLPGGDTLAIPPIPSTEPSW